MNPKFPEGMQRGRLRSCSVHSPSEAERPMVGDERPRRKIQLVDLNNFASFPTLAVGILVSALRTHGHEVKVHCPLAHNVPSSVRERRESRFHDWKRRIHLSTSPALRTSRNGLRNVQNWWIGRPNRQILGQVEQMLAEKPDILMMSAYLQYYPTVVEMGKLARAAGVPLLLGGAMFNLRQTARAWLDVPGLSAIYGGEADLVLAELVDAICKRRPLDKFPGVMTPDGLDTGAAPPLRNLDDAPFPDFADFPWDRYPTRIVPLMASRGCQWNKCLFCSDIVSASGRTFRTRSAGNVLAEMREQSRRLHTRNFLFLDLKLNSNPNLMRGISEDLQRHVPGAEWIGTVHVDCRKDNGLSRRDLEAAVRSGMRRVSFGLETGSQRLLDLMKKGSMVEANSEFIRHAHEAGLSVRTTMFKGYPGETAEDMAATADFLEAHAQYLDRVQFNEFSLLQGTPIFEAVIAGDRSGSTMKVAALNDRRANARYRTDEGAGHAYRREKSRALAVVHRINRKQLRSEARQFDGLM